MFRTDFRAGRDEDIERNGQTEPKMTLLSSWGRDKPHRKGEAWLRRGAANKKITSERLLHQEIQGRRCEAAGAEFVGLEEEEFI